MQSKTTQNLPKAEQVETQTLPHVAIHIRKTGLYSWLLRHRVALILALIVLAGAALRLFVLDKAHFIGDGDEALIGLMALHITQGRFPVFTYGLPYMAATESYFISLIYLVFGVSEAGMKIAPWLSSTGLIILNFFVARRFFQSSAAGLFAAVLTACPPLYLTITGLRAWGNFIETLLLGDALFLLAYYLVFTGKSNSWKTWGLFGLVLGYSFYGYWLAAFYYLPIFFFIFLKDKLFFLRRTFPVFIAAFFIGSLPFWLWNFTHDWATYHFFFDSPKTGNAVGGSGKPPALDVLNFFFSTSLRLVVGSYNYWFTVSSAIVLTLHVIYGLTFFGWLVARWRGLLGWFRLSLKTARPVDMLLLFVLLSPILYTISGVGTNAFSLPDLDTTGRYLLPLMGVAPLLLGGALARIGARGWESGVRDWNFSKSTPLSSPAYSKLETRNSELETQSSIKTSQSSALSPQSLLALGGLAVLLFCSLYPYRKADFVMAFQSPYYMNLRPPVDNRPVIDYLKQEGIEYATCNHWVGNRLMLNAADAVKCVDYFDIQMGGLERFPQLTAALLEPGRRVGFLLVNPSGARTPLEDRLDKLDVTFTRRDFTPYTVIIPRSRPVSPAEVLEDLRYPY